MSNPSSLSDAISQLEAATEKTQSGDLKQILEKDVELVKKALQNIKPHLEGLKKKAADEAREARDQAEEQIRRHPWAALGIAGLVGLILGLLLGNSRR